MNKSTSPLFSRGLPKWPQMVVSGVPVTREQALEVIRRTDTFFESEYSGGNDHSWNEWVRYTLGFPHESQPKFSDGPDGLGRPPTEEEQTAHIQRMHQLFEDQRAWRERWGFIPTEYVSNSWISCCFIYGAHGWMRPDGQIGFVDNVGKWPSVTAVHADWVTLAQAFPFLDLGVTLMSGEGNEEDKKPIVSFRVKNGKVRICDPARVNVHKGHRVPLDRSPADLRLTFSCDHVHEKGVDGEVIRSWAKQRGIVKTLVTQMAK